MMNPVATETYCEIDIVVVENELCQYDTYFVNTPGCFWIPVSERIDPIRGNANREQALEAGRKFIDAHQPCRHEVHHNGFYTLFARLWYGVERWGYVIQSDGTLCNGEAVFDSSEEAIDAGRKMLAIKIQNLEAFLEQQRQFRSALEKLISPSNPHQQ